VELKDIQDIHNGLIQSMLNGFTEGCPDVTFSNMVAYSEIYANLFGKGALTTLATAKATAQLFNKEIELSESESSVEYQIKLLLYALTGENS
jgi:hypothetical protein